MFTLSRRLIATVSIASLLGLFTTTVVPTVSSDGQAHAAAKKKSKKKKTVRTYQS